MNLLIANSMKKKVLIGILQILVQMFVLAQCPEHDLIFESQDSIDMFPNKYPNCENFNYNLTIKGEFIQDLSPFLLLHSIKNLNLTETDNISSLYGLNNLENVDQLLLNNNSGFDSITYLSNLNSLGSLTITNNSLKSLQGLENIDSLYDLRIYGNIQLEDLSGLNGLEKIGGVLEISNDSWEGLFITNDINVVALFDSKSPNSFENLNQYLPAKINWLLVSKDSFSFNGVEDHIEVYGIELTSIQNLELEAAQLMQFTPAILIENCQNLNSISPLENIALNGLVLKNNDNLQSLGILNKSLGQGIFIDGNDELTDISTLENQDTLHFIQIVNNPKLELCAWRPICRKLIGDPFLVDIQNNGSHCFSNETVIEQCLISLDENLNNKFGLTIHPNPVTDVLQIQSLLDLKMSYAIYNINGVKITSGVISNTSKISVSEIPRGIYFVSLRNNNNYTILKFIKI